MTIVPSSTPRGPIALKNVAAFMAMTTRLIERPAHLSNLGFAVCYGPSGFGKTQSSIFAQNKTRAISVEVGDSWSRGTLLKAVLRELSQQVKAREPVSAMAERAIEALGDDPGRPLIIDEADKLVDKGMVELARELQEKSGAPVILIGEERLPQKLLQVERVHNRVLDWFPAQPCDLEDARLLFQAFLPQLTMDDDLLDLIRQQSAGRVRRILKNFDDVAQFARNKGISKLDRKTWGHRSFDTGAPPAVRNVEVFAKKTAAVA